VGTGNTSIVEKLANPSKMGSAKVTCEAEVWVLSANLTWKLGSRLVGSCLALILTIGMTSCEANSQRIDRQAPDPISETSAATASLSALVTTDGPLSEVNTPESIRKLAPSLEKFHPQVRILSPQPDEILADDRVTVKLTVEDLPLFKQPELGLGNHLHVILDKETYRGVYDLSQPLVFKNLAAGTHTLRVFASRPWHESFKNSGAYALATFHVLTKTADNHPDPQLPLLTYSRPAGTYGAEPILLDYYLTNPPTHSLSESSSEQLPNWRIRVTINQQRFILDRWAPIYLQGFKRGKNLVRLELLDDRGNPIPNVYNDSVSIFTYDPQQQDSLAKLVRGEIDPNLALTLVAPNYAAIQPTPAPPTPSVAPVPVNTPSPTPAPSVVPTPVTTPSPIATPLTAPTPVNLPSPIPTPSSVTTNTITPPTTIVPVPVPANTPTPVPVQIVPSPIAIVPTPVAEPTPSPAQPQPSPSPVLVPIVPSVAPSPPTSAPIASNPDPTPESPRPAPIAKPSPVTIPTPPVVTSSPKPNPEPVTTPKPVMPQPAPSVAPVPVVIAVPTPAASPSIPVPQVEDRVEKTWQTNAIEILNAARAKTRAFTNTIPAKAQRFGRNLRIWGNKAIELVQELRDRKIQGSNPDV
jgi:hypothetical protein